MFEYAHNVLQTVFLFCMTKKSICESVAQHHVRLWWYGVLMSFTLCEVLCQVIL